MHNQAIKPAVVFHRGNFIAQNFVFLRPVTLELRPHGVRAASSKMQNAMVRAVRSTREQKQLRGISVGRRQDS